MFNIGNHQPVDLLQFIELIEKNLGREARKILLPMQPGDVPETSADIEGLRRYVDFAPATPVETGVDAIYRMVQGILWQVKAGIAACKERQ